MPGAGDPEGSDHYQVSLNTVKNPDARTSAMNVLV